jgi:hypothetical protein
MSSNPLFDIIVGVYRTSKTVTIDRISDLLLHGPNYYSEWWISLLRESPEHLIIETGLMIFILWIIFIRRTVDPSKTSKNPKLTKKEEQWLVDTWQPDPLVPKLTSKQQRIVDSSWVRGSTSMHCISPYCLSILHLGDRKRRRQSPAHKRSVCACAEPHFIRFSGVELRPSNQRRCEGSS